MRSLAHVEKFYPIKSKYKPKKEPCNSQNQIPRHPIHIQHLHTDRELYLFRCKKVGKPVQIKDRYVEYILSIHCAL